MTYHSKSRIRIALLIVGFLLLLCLPLLLWGVPTPPPISDADLAKIPKSEIRDTIKHREALYLDLQAKYDSQQIHIVDQDQALVDSTSALTDLLNKEIPSLKAQIQTQTDKLNGCETSLAKASKALWWYRIRWWGGIVMAVIGIVACVVVWGGKILVKLGLKSAI